MAIPISNVTRRVVYEASGTGPYAFTFEILASTDIAVYKDDTLLTLTTDYTVTINTNGTGSVTLVTSPTGATQIAIVGNRTIQRSTDFTTGGDFFANTLNDELDQQTIFAQQNAEGLARALTAPQTDPTTIDMTLPRASERANKYLAFDADGNPQPGDTAVEVAAIAGIADDITAVAAIDTDVSAVAAIDSNVTTVAGISANVTTVAGISANVTTVAGLSSDIATVVANIADIQSADDNATAAQAAQAAAESARDATLAAYDNFDDRYLGTKTSDPTLDNDGNALVAGALYFNSVSGIMKVYTGSAWVAAYVSGSSYLPLSGGTLTGQLTAPLLKVSASTATLDLTSTSNIYSVINFGDAGDSDIGQIYYDHPNNAMKFYTNNVERMAISNAGVVSVGGNTVLDAGDLGVSVQAYDADTAKTDVAQTFTISQRGTVTTDNDLSLDLNVTNNFKATLAGAATLTFTNITAGQSGFILLVNTSGYTVSAHANTKVSTTALATISAAGTYLLSYFSDGTNVYVVNSGALA